MNRRPYKEPFSLELDTREEEGPLGTPCKVWRWAKTKGGYGVVKRNRRNLYAHRLFYEMLVGRIPGFLEVNHLCERTACVNPEHLELVTKSQNMSYVYREK